MIPFINLKRQYIQIREEILDVTDKVLASGQLMNGPLLAKLEEQLSARTGIQHIVCVGSGTSALEMIARFHYDTFFGVLERKPIVLVPALTYPATINAFITTGWDVVIIDVDPETGILELNKVTQEFDAVCIVGLYGQAVFEDWLLRRRYHHTLLSGKILIEDAAQHWLAQDYSQQPIMKAISFDPTKNLANYGNGGAIATHDSYAADWFKMYRDNGKPHVNSYGTNSRMSEVDAAQLLVKLKYLDEWQDRRLEIALYYLERFANNPKIRCIMKLPHMHGLQKFVIEVDHRDLLRDLLYTIGIECKVHYERPLHEMEPYAGLPGPSMLSAASALSRRVLSLPFYPELTDSEIEYVADQVIKYSANENIGLTNPNHN
jgi:dTDP-4-amino-4,6-dideoxygalactose transaminase